MLWLVNGDDTQEQQLETVEHKVTHLSISIEDDGFNVKAEKGEEELDEWLRDREELKSYLNKLGVI